MPPRRNKASKKRETSKSRPSHPPGGKIGFVLAEARSVHFSPNPFAQQQLAFISALCKLALFCAIGPSLVVTPGGGSSEV
jgi:hypothetical protein